MNSIIDEIKQGCFRLENIIGDLLKSSKLESGLVQLNRTYGNLTFLIKYCVREVESIAKGRNQTISLNLRDKIMTVFEKEKIHDVIVNLLINAIKNTPRNGKISIESMNNENFIVISVLDNGIGITKEEKSKLFTQFGKIERYGKGLDLGIEGSGLGLYIAKEIVELHGGEIWADSDGRNKGSTFSFSLPIKKESQDLK